MPHRCWAEIDLASLAHNAGVARQAVAAGGEVMAVVKADAYGHGMAAVAAALEPHADAFGVASVEEGMRLRSAGCRRPVMLLGAVVPDQFLWVIEHGLQASVSSLAEAELLDSLAGAVGKKAEIHLVFDTGMGRIGFLGAGGLERLAELSHLEP